MNIQDKLYKKLSNEYEQFLDDLKQKPIDEIINKSYEKVFKEDLLICFEEKNINTSKAKALMKLEYPLDALYQEWLDSDISYMDMLQDCIDNTINELQKSEADKKSRKSEQPAAKPKTLADKLQEANEKVKAQDTQNNNEKSRKKEERG